MCSGGHPRRVTHHGPGRGRRERQGSASVSSIILSVGCISKQPVLSLPPNMHRMFPTDTGWSSLSADAVSAEGLCPPAQPGRETAGTGRSGRTSPSKPWCWESCLHSSTGRGENITCPAPSNQEDDFSGGFSHTHYSGPPSLFLFYTKYTHSNRCVLVEKKFFPPGDAFHRNFAPVSRDGFCF